MFHVRSSGGEALDLYTLVEMDAFIARMETTVGPIAATQRTSGSIASALLPAKPEVADQIEGAIERLHGDADR